jgi:hypothetical protein
MMTSGSSEADTKDDYQEAHALRSALAKFGVLISIAQARDVTRFSKPYAIRTLLDNYDAGHRPITEDLIRQIHQVFLEEIITVSENSNRIKSLL